MAVAIESLSSEVASRTRVLRGGPDEAPWELWQRTPPQELRGLVAGLWAGTSPEASARHRTLPNGELTLMLHLGPAQRLVEQGGAACSELLRDGFVAGLQEQPACFACLERDTRVAAARLEPLGGWMLFHGLPQAELTGRVLEAETALGSRAGVAALRERMGEAPDLGVALDWLEAWLVRRFRAAGTPHPAMGAAIAMLRRSGGALRIDHLAQAAGLSPRRLHELFLREAGVPAKRLARVLRFRGALERLATAPAVDLARLAQECGYYDQSHLYRDFRRLAGMTPLAYRAALGDGLDGPDVVPG